VVPTREGLGMSVVEWMVREELKGEMHLDWRAEVLPAKLSFKCNGGESRATAMEEHDARGNPSHKLLHCHR